MATEKVKEKGRGRFMKDILAKERSFDFILNAVVLITFAIWRAHCSRMDGRLKY